MKVRDLPKGLLNSQRFEPDNNNIYDIPALWLEDNTIKLIDQRLLPDKFELFEAKDYNDSAYVIKDMVVRGAPAIGAMAAYAMAQAAVQEKDMALVSETLLGTRPTAFDLFYAVKHMQNELASGTEPVKAAQDYVDDIITRCKKIGEVGSELIENGYSILTHCNAGALASVDFGTALAPIRHANRQGKDIFVYVDETRPRLQGAKLTAWELYHEKIPHALIVDNAAGFYLNQGKINLVITGADRIARNGDAANKIGTYEKAVLAKENGVPFYIAAPISTIDFDLETGKEIPIEDRNQDEVLMINDYKITQNGVTAFNPAFDVTPNKFITGFITEFGLIKPNEIKAVVEKNIQ